MFSQNQIGLKRDGVFFKSLKTSSEPDSDLFFLDTVLSVNHSHGQGMRFHDCFGVTSPVLELASVLI